MKNIIVIGADVSGMNIFTVIQDTNRISSKWKVIAYLDEYKKHDGTLFGIPIFNTFEDIISRTGTIKEETYVISAIGSPRDRLRLMKQAESKGFKLATIIHPSANISDYAKIEEGCIICQFASVHPFAHVKRMSYIHTAVVIGPKVTIGEAVTINSLCAISSNTKIGDYCYVGVGTKVIQKINIGKNATLGAGSVIIKDVPENCLAAGVPAEIKKRNHNGN